MKPVEVLTLAPLVALIVIFGLFPGLVLDLVQGTAETLDAVASAEPVDLAGRRSWRRPC